MGTAKILLQLDSLNQYDRFELQHQYVSINIKEVMSISKIFTFYLKYSHQFLVNSV